MSDWRPGLPSEPCVCDVRVLGEPARIATYLGLSPDGLFARFSSGGVIAHGPAWRAPESVMWRPIEVPAGVPADA